MSVIPKQARYAMLPLGVPSSRRTIRVNPIDGGSAYAPDSVNVCRIRMPQQGYLDCQSSYLTFKLGRKNAATANAMGASDNMEMRLENGGAAWIKNLSVLGNDGTVVENIQNYNLLQAIVGKATLSDEYLNTPAAECAGWGDDAQRSSWFRANKEYAIQLNHSGLMNNPKYLPLKFIAGGLEIMLELAPTAECCRRGDSQTGEYEITNVQYVCDIVDFTDEFDNMFRQQMASEGVNLHFDHYKNHVASIDSQQPRIQLSERTTSLKSVLAVMRLSADASDASKNSLSDWKSASAVNGTGGLSKYSFTLGAERYPRFDLDASNGSCRAYSEAQKAFGVYGDVGAANQIKYYGTAKDGATNVNTTTVRGASVGGGTGTDCWSQTSGLATVHNRIISFKQQAAGVDANSGEGVLTSPFPHGLTTGTRCRILFENSDTAARINQFSATAAETLDNASNGYFVAFVVSPTEIRALHNLPAQQDTETLNVGCVFSEFDDDRVILCAVEDKNAVSGNDDRDFYIGQNFEVHNEGGLLRTGLDVTAAVPLHIEMEFDGAAPAGLRLDAFVHTDKVAQLGADGLFVVAN